MPRTDRFRRVLICANQEAIRLNHEYIGTEHLLLGLIREGRGMGVSTLKSLQIDLDEIKKCVERLVKRGPEPADPGKFPLTPPAKRIIKYASEEAANLNHGYVGTEHLLIGIVREEQSIAWMVLTHAGVTLQTARDGVRRLLGQSD